MLTNAEIFILHCCFLARRRRHPGLLRRYLHEKKSAWTQPARISPQKCHADAARRWHLPAAYKRNDPPRYDGNTASGHCEVVWQHNVYNRAA